MWIFTLHVHVLEFCTHNITLTPNPDVTIFTDLSALGPWGLCARGDLQLENRACHDPEDVYLQWRIQGWCLGCLGTTLGSKDGPNFRLHISLTASLGTTLQLRKLSLPWIWLQNLTKKPVCRDRKLISIEIFGCSTVPVAFAAMIWAWFRLRVRDQKILARASRAIITKSTPLLDFLDPPLTWDLTLRTSTWDMTLRDVEKTLRTEDFYLRLDPEDWSSGPP